MKLYTMAWRNVRRNSRRTALSASAIGIAAMTLILLFSLLAGLTEEMSFNLRTFYSGEIRVRHSEYDKFAHLNPLHLSVTESTKVIDAINREGLFQHISARIPFPSAIYQDGENLSAAGMGFDVNSDLMDTANYLVQGRMPKPGEREVILGTRITRDLNLGIGDKFTALSMTMRRASNGMTFTVVGIVGFPLSDMNSRYYVPIDITRRFLKMGDNSIDLVLKTNADVDVDIAVLAVERVLLDLGIQHTKVEIWDDISSSFAYLSLARMVYFIMGLVFYILASTVIINTMMMVIFERTREIGTLASLGMDGREIVKLFLIEAIIISAIGSFSGTLIGSVLTYILQQTGIDMTQAMEGVDFEISGVIYPQLTSFNVIYAFVSGVVVASLASLIPSRRAAKIKPVEAMQSL